MKKIITMLSALTITSTIALLTVACNIGKDKDEEVVLDLNELTSDMILNFDTSFCEDDNSVGTALEKLAGLNEFAIDIWLRQKVSKIFSVKLSGLSKPK